MFTWFENPKIGQSVQWIWRYPSENALKSYLQHIRQAEVKLPKTTDTRALQIISDLESEKWRMR